MGGQKGDRKSYKATSAAKAAEALAAKGGAGGFGGFSGTRPVAGFGFGAPAAGAASPAVASTSAAADPLELSAQLDGELAQCLRHLSKRDTTTKLKALQSLEELITQKTPADLAIMLQPWGYHFKRLLLDPSKAVRIKAVAVMAAVAAAVGKALLPQLKSLLGPWYLASFDPYPDAAAAARKSLAEVFPGRKQLDALIYCRSDVLAHITACMASTPQSLGDPKKDTAEELEERHERVVTASLSAAADLLTIMQQAATQQQQEGTDASSSAEPAAAGGATAAAAAAGALQDVHEKVAEILATPGFFKQKLNSKSPVVQRAAYGFIQAVSRTAPQLLKPCLGAAAPSVLGALQDKEPSNHPAMWAMLLAFVTSQQPDCWAAVNLQKAVVPRLLSLLRHGCYGSSVTSLPALLPFLALLPRSALAPQPLLLLDQVLESIWIGQQQQGAAARGDRSTTAAVAAAYQECLCWGLRNAAVLSSAAATGGSSSASDSTPELAAAAAGDSSSSDAEEYCRQLLASGHFSSLVQLALSSSSPDAHLASEILQGVLLQLCSAPALAASGNSSELPLQLQVFLSAVGDTIQAALVSSCQQQPPSGQQTGEAAAGSEAAAGRVCCCLQQYMDALTDSTGSHSQAAASQLAHVCCVALLPLVQAGQQLPAPAANLLARLIREHPAAARMPLSAAAAPAAAAAAGSPAGQGAAAGGGLAATAGSSSNSIAALVRLGMGSCAVGNDLPAADAELLLSCVAGSSNASAAWGVLLSEVLTAGHSTAALHFLDTLLQQAASSNQLLPAPAAAAAGGAAAKGPVEGESWSHPLLDSYVSELLQQLQQQEFSTPAPAAGTEASLTEQGVFASSDDSSGAGGWGSGLTRQQAAAASLLGCCLGANKQQMVLLSSDTLSTCMEAMDDSLATALQQQEQQQQAPPKAAAPFVAALGMVLGSSAHVPSSITSSSAGRAPVAATRSSSNGSLWQQQPQHLKQLLLLLWQLSWGAGTDSSAEAVAAAFDSDTSSSDGSSAVDSGSDSSFSDDDSSQAEEAAQQDVVPAGSDQGVASSTTDSGAGAASQAAWQGLLAAAASICRPELLSMAVTELPDASAVLLMQQLQQLLVHGLRDASAAAAAGSAGSPSVVSSAVAAGTQWACRAGVVLEGLQAHQEQQQELVQQLLTAVDHWQHWLHTRRPSSSDMDSTHVLMLQFSAVLVLQAGCNVVLPLHHGHLLPSTRGLPGPSGARSSSDTATDNSRLWLRLELLCAGSSCEMLTGGPSKSIQSLLSSSSGDGGGAGAASSYACSDGLVKCVSVAADVAERQLVKAAGKGSSGAASAVAREQLSAALGQLLAAAGTAAAASSSGRSGHQVQVYSATLQRLLSQVGAAVATSTAACVHLLPVLQQFVQQQVAPAMSDCMDQVCATAATAAAPGAVAVLAPVLEQCAHAFRFAAVDDSALIASGFADLSVKLMHKATVQPADAESSATAGKLLQLLQLAVACFPTQQQPQPQRTHQSQAQERDSVVCTAAERKGLAALLQHVCSATPAGAGSAGAPLDADAAELQCQLQLCCVTYCWAEMMAAEWHIVLRDAQQRLTLSRREVEKAAGSLAGAVCTAAQQLVGARGSSSAAALSAPMAVQLLRRLEQKGLLRQQPAAAEALLAAATAAGDQLSQLSVLQLALEVLASVLQLQEKIQAAGRAPQLGLALAAAWRELLALLLALGAAVAVASCCGDACSSSMLQYCQARGSTWLLLQQCLHGCSEAGGDAVGNVLSAADDKAELLGVDAVGSCLALLQQGGFHHQHHHHNQHHILSVADQQECGCKPLQQLAWELLLHPVSLAGITHAATASSGSDDTEGVPEYGVSDDAAAYLVKVGLRPEMAGGLASSKPWQMHVLLWALLLAHVAKLPGRSVGQRRLCQVLREVPELVPDVLDRVASLMGLGGSSKASHAAAGDGELLPTASGALSATAQASLSTSLQAAGTAVSKSASVLSGGSDSGSSIWDVAVALRSIGLPHSHSSWRLLAAAVYRAVLCTLPASARIWFSDLRDRSRSTAVESYTSRYESPALLAAEFASIKRDAAGSSGEVGGSCSFRVVANPANREVTAVLEIEDGATLELVVKLPAAAPLKAPEVDCKNKVGIKDGRLRKWLLSIAVFLRNQNQGVLDGISMWKANLEQEFAGVEACLICYSVISAANGQLPRISCKQCNVKFHPACLYKWFRSSGKSTCPHCSALF